EKSLPADFSPPHRSRWATDSGWRCLPEPTTPRKAGSLKDPRSSPTSLLSLIGIEEGPALIASWSGPLNSFATSEPRGPVKVGNVRRHCDWSVSLEGSLLD